MLSGPAEFYVRPFKLGDLAEVYEIENNSFREPWPKISFIVFHYKEPEGFKVAVSGDRIIGYSIVTTESTGKGQRKIAHLMNLAIRQEFRRRGIGRRLVEMAIDYGREKRAWKMELEVAILNRAAVELYRMEGFTERRTIKGYYNNGEDAAVMEINL